MRFLNGRVLLVKAILICERFYDNSLVQELIHEGFYKSLWSK